MIKISRRVGLFFLKHGLLLPQLLGYLVVGAATVPLRITIHSWKGSSQSPKTEAKPTRLW